MTETKVCDFCGSGFTRPKGLAFDTFARRRYCSRACNRSDASRPVTRLNAPDKKRCEMCGVIFTRPDNQRGKIWASRKYCSMLCVNKARSVKAWEARPERICPICNTIYRTSIGTQMTCGEPVCIQRYKREIAGPKVAARAREAYAAGTRPRMTGVSVRELYLRPHLEPLGWQWRLKWYEGWGCFEMDFCLMEAKVNIELDGPEHYTPKNRAKDAKRDAELERRGWRILRIPNAEVDADPLAVIAKITAFAS